MSLLTIPQAAERLGLREATIRFWVWRRKIEFVRVGGRAIRIPETAVAELIARGTVRPRPVRESF